MPLFAKDVFARGAWGLGALEGALGAGMMGAAFWMARVGTVSRPVSLAAGSFAIQGWLMLLMGLVPRFEGYLLGLMGLGAALSALNVVMVSAFQRAIPPEQLGRFMGVLTTVVMGVMPLSFGLVGVMASWIPPTRIFDASGTMLIAVSLLLPLLPGVRGLQAELSAS